MGKTWILDSETKGTGAHVVPLEKALKRPSSEQDLAIVTLEGPPRASESIEPPAPLSFKVVDIRSSQVLAEDISARATVELLEGVGSVVDVRIYVRPQAGKRWRLLTLAEQKALWAFREQGPLSVASAAAG
jgi:hypothetical protein